MIIANIKSAQDLLGKKTLQQQLLDLEVANESELEKRVKDYKNPNKPIPVAPEYKTNAELQKDKILQEQKAIRNMEELGFDYGKSAELVAWLSSSLINKLVEFNANFKGIKKELTETTNPKLISLDFVKNYLEKYFEDIDINYGRKFSKENMSGTITPATIDELSIALPSTNEVERLRGMMAEVMSFVRTDQLFQIRASKEDCIRWLEDNNLTRDEIDDLDERTRKDYLNEKRMRMKEIEDDNKYLSFIVELIPKMRYAETLVDLYSAIIPTQETFNLLKTALTQQERGDVIRRYMTILKSLHFLSKSGVEELTDELGMLSSRRPIELDALNIFTNKLTKSLSFLTKEKGIDQISKLQRDIEVLMNQSGKIAELDQFKILNDIREKRVREAENVVKNAMDLSQIELFDTTDLKMDIGSERKARDLIADREKAEELDLDRARALEIQAERRRISQLKREGGLDTSMIGMFYKDQEPQREDPRLQFTHQAKTENRQTLIREIQKLHQNFAQELYDLYAVNEGSAINTAKGFLIEYGGFNTKKKQDLLGRRTKSGETTDEQFERLLGYIEKLAEKKDETIRDQVISGEIKDPLDYDFYATANRARIYNKKNNPTPDITTYGIGLRKSLKQHFKEDEAELKNMARALRKHKAMEKKIDKYAQEESSSEDEMKGGSLGFRHKKIKVGKGISVRQQPSYKTFGKYVIHMGHLLDKNVANFKYPSLGSIPAIKPMTISEDYKEFLIDTIENGRPNERILNKLPTEEQRHFERVVAGAGLIDTFKLKRNHTEQERKEAERFNLLRGEVLAGNNSDKVLRELRSLIVRFMNEGRILQKEGTSMLMELSSI